MNETQETISESVEIREEDFQQEIIKDNKIAENENHQVDPEKKSIERPEYIPEQYWDKEKNSPKFEDAFKKLKETEEHALKLRKVLSDKKSFEEYKKSQGEEVIDPENLEYDFESLDPSIAETFSEDHLNIYKEIAKESGLKNDQALTILKNYSDKIKSAQDAKRAEELEKLGPDANNLLDNLKDFGQGKVNAKMFSEEEFSSYLEMIKSASSARILAKIIELTGEKPIPKSVGITSDMQSFQRIKEEYMEAVKESGGKETTKVQIASQKIEDYFNNQ